MLATSMDGLSSAFAGVYFEKFVKKTGDSSLWVRNMQLSLWGLPMSIAYALVKDNEKIRCAGLLQGFDAVTLCVVLLQVFGGLVVGLVVKYTDNIMKNFANAVSVILTVLLSIPLFGLSPSFNFLFGVATVMYSVFLYGSKVSLRSVLS